MKKMIISAVFAIISLSASAQWSTLKNNDDELLGTGTYYTYIYQSPSGDSFVYWSNNYSFRVTAGSGIFHYRYDDGDRINALIGYYYNGKMVDREVHKLYVPEGDRECMTTQVIDGWKLADRIQQHLENGGTVRIVSDKYGGADFDLSIPPRKKGNPSLAMGEVVPRRYNFASVAFGDSKSFVLDVYGENCVDTGNYLLYKNKTFFNSYWNTSTFIFEADKLKIVRMTSVNRSDVKVAESDVIDIFNSSLKQDYVVYKFSEEKTIKTDTSTVRVMYGGWPRSTNREEPSFKYSPQIQLGVETSDTTHRAILIVTKP